MQPCQVYVVLKNKRYQKTSSFPIPFLTFWSELAAWWPANFRRLWAIATNPNSVRTFVRPRNRNRVNDKLPWYFRTHFRHLLYVVHRWLLMFRSQELFWLWLSFLHISCCSELTIPFCPCTKRFERAIATILTLINFLILSIAICFLFGLVFNPIYKDVSDWSRTIHRAHASQYLFNSSQLAA